MPKLSRSKTQHYQGIHRSIDQALISHAVWLYHRFCLSFRDVEDLLAQRGITVSYEAIRLWCLKFGPEYARALKRRQGRLGNTWHSDEVFVTIQGQRHDSYRSMESFRISSVSDVTCWGLPIIGSYEVEPFSFGMRQPVSDA